MDGKLPHSKTKHFNLPERIWTLGFLSNRAFPVKLAVLIFITSNIQIFFLILSSVRLLLEDRLTRFESTSFSVSKFITVVLSNIVSDLRIYDYVVIVVEAIYLLACLVLLIVIIVKIFKKRPASKLLADVWEIGGQFHFYIWFLPIHNHLLGLISSCLDNQDNLLEGIVITVIIFSVFGLVINSLMVLSTFLRTTFIKTASPFSRLSNHFQFISILQVFVTPLLLALSKSERIFVSTVWMVGVFHIGISVIRMYYVVNIPPFFNKILSNIAIIFSTFYLIFSSWFIIEISVSGVNSSKTTGALATIMFVSSPLIIKGVFVLVDLVLNQEINLKKNSNYIGKYLYALRLRKQKKVLKEPNVEKESRILNEKILLELGYKSYSKETKDLSDHSDLGEFLNEITKNTRHSALVNLTIADLLLNRCHFVFRAYVVLKKILKSIHVSYSEKLTALSLLGGIQAILLQKETRNIELVDFIESMRIHDSLAELLEAQIIVKDAFYKLLEVDDPCIDTLSDISSKVQFYQNEIEKIWVKLTKEQFENYPPLLKTFSLYKLLVELRPEMGRELMNKYNDMMIKKTQTEATKGRKFYSTNTVFLLVGAETKDLGKVINCTFNIKNIFGYTQKEILNRDIAVLMPQTIASVHDAILKTSLEKAASSLDSLEVDNFGLHQRGHIFPLKIRATIYPIINDGLAFFAMLKQYSSGHDYILLNDNLAIEGVTVDIKNSFAHELKELTPLYTLCRLEQHIIHNEERSTPRVDFKTMPAVKPGPSNFMHYLAHSQTVGYKQAVSTANQFEKNFKEFVDNRSQFILYFQRKILKDTRSGKFLCEAEPLMIRGKRVFKIQMKKIYFRSMNSPENSHEDMSNMHEIQRFETGVNGTCYSPIKRLKVAIDKSTSEQLKQQSAVFQDSAGSESRGDDSDMIYDKNEDDKDFDIKESEGFEKRAPSKFAASSQRIESQGYLTLNHTVDSMRFLKFREGYVPFVFLIIFMAAFLSFILIAFQNATSSRNEIEGRLTTLITLSKQGQDMSVILIDLFPIWVKNGYTQKYFEADAMYYLGLLGPPFLDMIKQSNVIKNNMESLTQEEIDFLFAKDLKMYYDDFDNIPDSPYYEKVDMFQLMQALYSYSRRFAVNYRNTRVQIRWYSLSFLYGNVMNDLWNKVSSAPEVLIRNMQVKVDNINSFNNYAFFISLITLILLALSIFLLLIKGFKDKQRFYNTIISTNNTSEISQTLFNLKLFKKYLNKLLHGVEADYAKPPAKQQAKKEVYKRGRTTKLLKKYVARFVWICPFLISPMIINNEVHKTFMDAVSNVMPITYDLNNLNKIVKSCVPIVGYMGLSYTRPQTKIGNIPIKDVVDPTIEAAKESVSLENNFLPETLDFLNSNICPYYEKNIIFPDCYSIFKGLGAKGIITSALASVEYSKTYMTAVRAATIVPGENSAYYVNQRDFQQMGFLFLLGVGNAIKWYQEQMIDELNTILNDASNHVLMLFIPAVIIGILLSAATGILIFTIMRKERRGDAFTLNLLPLDHVMNNRNLKGYLLKQSRHFQLLVKRYESSNRSSGTHFMMAKKGKKV